MAAARTIARNFFMGHFSFCSNFFAGIKTNSAETRLSVHPVQIR